MDGSDEQGKKPNEKKNAPQANNLVWYLLGLGIVLLLLATVWSGQERLSIGWSDLKRLVEAAHPDNEGTDKAHIIITLDDGKTEAWVERPSQIRIAPATRWATGERRADRMEGRRRS